MPQPVDLYKKLWIPDGAMNALVIMVHGIGEHSGCYNNWAEKFVEHSTGFLAFDLRGHGKSPGVRGHASLRVIMDDLQAIIEDIQKKYPNISIFLLGNSMGGQIALNCAISENIKVQGIIASSPWLKLERPPSPILVWLARGASHIAPWFTVRTGVRADQLSTGGAGIKSTKTDPLLHKKISIKLFSDLWKNGDMLLRNRRRIHIPLLLMYGTADPLTSYHAGKSFVQNAGEYATFKQWNGMRHDLLNDADSEVVFQYVMKWLSKQMIENGTVPNSGKM